MKNGCLQKESKMHLLISYQHSKQSKKKIEWLIYSDCSLNLFYNHGQLYENKLQIFYVEICSTNCKRVYLGMVINIVRDCGCCLKGPWMIF
jgi:hypothetical protein